QDTERSPICIEHRDTEKISSFHDRPDIAEPVIGPTRYNIFSHHRRHWDRTSVSAALANVAYYIQFTHDANSNAAVITYNQKIRVRSAESPGCFDDCAIVPNDTHVLVCNRQQPQYLHR